MNQNDPDAWIHRLKVLVDDFYNTQGDDRAVARRRLQIFIQNLVRSAWR